MLVVFPRITERKKKIAQVKETVPIFFGGIAQYRSSEEYIEKLNSLMENPDDTYKTFAKSVYTIGKINSFKNKHLKLGNLLLSACRYCGIRLNFLINIFCH
jgi:hypothetical protein